MKTEEFENGASRFSVDGKHFENGALRFSVDEKHFENEAFRKPTLFPGSSVYLEVERGPWERGCLKTMTSR